MTFPIVLYNGDTGNINRLLETDFFVIGMSKCGTTTLYQSLNVIAPTLKYHSDYTLERVYKTEVFTTKKLFEERRKIDRNFYVFVPYRNPIDRKVSQYYQYELSQDKSKEQKIKEIKEFCLGNFSLFSEDYRTEVDEELTYANIINATNIDLFSYSFDGDIGYNVIYENKLILIPYTLERINNLAGILKKLYPEFTLINGRVSEINSENIILKSSLKFTEIELEKIYNNFYCKYFYTDEQIENFKRRFRE